MIPLLRRLATVLGYLGDRGFIDADAFSHQPNHRHALRLAAQQMGVSATFGLWTGPEGSLLGPDHRRFTPLVYLAEAKDAEDARRIHRSVWSQGLVPYLLVAAQDQIWLCQGFAYSATEWDSHAVEIKAEDWPQLTDAIGPRSALRPIRASALRSSLAWRDEARAADDFVDQRLLQSLAHLSIAFTEGYRGQAKLPADTTNALVARLLYFYFLVDRRFITQERLQAWGLQGVGLDERAWTLDGTAALFERLDEVFNGSIFPMPARHNDAYQADHINALRSVIRHGAEAAPNGALQLSFLDYDFASIRTETLSAIYEMFLRNEVEDAGTRFGAFYTPPYLADYVLDRLEDDKPLCAGVRVLDPAAGSGVFLVGAYRRIVEASLQAGETCIGLETLHALMTQSIFAVELNATACHVAAFSLYLTMLDYVEPEEAADYTCWPVVTGRPKLFPPMLKADHGRPNILAADFFAPETQGLRCDVVVGNPPWVQLPKLESVHADAYFKARKKSGRPIGDKQAAELFTWKAYEDHLEPEGALGLLLPQKSLVNKFSEKFADALRTETELVGIADLAHLRYALFRRSSARMAGSNAAAGAKGARQATAAILLRKRQPRPDHKFWSFRPLRQTQPSSRRNRLWNLVHDWTQVTWHVQSELTSSSWRRVFTCSPADRRVLGQFDRQVAAGRLKRLSDLEALIGLKFKIEVDQNLDDGFKLSQNPRSPTYWLDQLGVSGGLFSDMPSMAYPLPQAQIDKAIASAKPFLQGNVVLLQRTCERALFVEKPVATSFMIVACFPDLAGRALPKAQTRFLHALAGYLSTRTFRYLAYINSRRVFSDRANVELGAVTELPWPFDIGDEQALTRLLAAEPSVREAIVGDALGLPPSYQALVREYDSFREHFNDGGMPPEALLPATPDEMQDYLQSLLLEIDGHKGRHSAHAMTLNHDLASAVIRYLPGGAPPDRAADEAAVSEALEAYKAQGASSFTQSRYLWHSRRAMATVLIKPRERLHWTLDRAFSDADLITAAVLGGVSSREAA